jgi:hypothetical protein
MQTMSIHESGQKSRGGVRMKEKKLGVGIKIFNGCCLQAGLSEFSFQSF